MYNVCMDKSIKHVLPTCQDKGDHTFDGESFEFDSTCQINSKSSTVFSLTEGVNIVKILKNYLLQNAIYSYRIIQKFAQF